MLAIQQPRSAAVPSRKVETSLQVVCPMSCLEVVLKEPLKESQIPVRAKTKPHLTASISNANEPVKISWLPEDQPSDQRRPRPRFSGRFLLVAERQ